RDEAISDFEEWGRKRFEPTPLAHELHHRLDAATFTFRFARDVDVASASLFESEANELAAALNGWPIIELVECIPRGGLPRGVGHGGEGRPTGIRRQRALGATTSYPRSGP